MHDLTKTKKPSVKFETVLTLSHVLEHGKGDNMQLQWFIKTHILTGLFSERFAKWAFRWNLGFIDIHDLYKSLGYDSGIDNQESWADESNLSSAIKG